MIASKMTASVVIQAKNDGSDEKTDMNNFERSDPSARA